MVRKSAEKLFYDKKIPIEICNKVRKLCDHVNLEVGRYNLMVNKIESRIVALQNRSNDGGTSSSAEDLNKRMSDIEKMVKIRHMRRQKNWKKLMVNLKGIACHQLPL